MSGATALRLGFSDRHRRLDRDVEELRARWRGKASRLVSGCLFCLGTPGDATTLADESVPVPASTAATAGSTAAEVIASVG